MYLLFCSILTVIWPFFGEGHEILLYSEFANKGCGIAYGGAVFTIKTGCLPPSALCSCFRDNLRNSYHLPVGLVLKLHPFSEESGGFNLFRIRHWCVYGFNVYIDFIHL